MEITATSHNTTMAITRHKATTAEGARFYFADESRARTFAASTGGQYHGLVTFPSIVAFMASHA